MLPEITLRARRRPADRVARAPSIEDPVPPGLPEGGDAGGVGADEVALRPGSRGAAAPMAMPAPLPEMTLRAAGVVPPIVLSASHPTDDHAGSHRADVVVPVGVGADEVALDPVAALGRASIETCRYRSRLITSPRTVLSPAVIVRPSLSRQVARRSARSAARRCRRWPAVFGLDPGWV